MFFTIEQHLIDKCLFHHQGLYYLPIIPHKSFLFLPLLVSCLFFYDLIILVVLVGFIVPKTHSFLVLPDDSAD